MFTYLSPAKVNLFFKVLSKRKDGYHNIASLYQVISLFDLISIKKSKVDKFFCFNNKALKFNDNNLVIKALKAFRNETKIIEPVEIYLKKNIPMEAGLGGGSSNAATTIWALNELFHKPLSLEKLIKISKPIGADVPFFFSNGTAFCTDIGNQFEDIQLEKKLNFFIAKPEFGVSTKQVYENVDLNLIKKVSISEIKDNLLKSIFSYSNDLEISAFKVEPKLQSIKKHLVDMGFDRVVMTGSGSSFMCFGNKKFLKSEKVKFFPVFNIQKNEGTWYALH